MKKAISVFIVAIAIALRINANPGDTSTIANLKRSISYLASDDLEGRLTGSKGENKAADYIIKEYKSIGVTPMGNNGSFIQEFPYNAGKKTDGKNELVINGIELKLNEEYFPLNISANDKAKGSVIDVGYGISAPQIRYDSYTSMRDLKGKIFLMECSTPEGDNPHSKYAPYADIKSRVDNAITKGAVAIIFTNTNAKADDLKSNLDIKSYETTIPVIFIKGDAWKKVKRDQLNVASTVVHLKEIMVVGHNVVGFIDNHASTTVVIGGHYDHLGYDEFGGSLYRGDAAIHNGADDNASGTAGVIEIARWIATNGVTEKNNFLFINFSGEEEGLIGSKYWVEHATYDTSKINFMINLDMIGRYRNEKGLEIDGLGSSPNGFSFLSHFTFDTLKLILKDQGVGPSDHTSFYLADKPVLFFFTGTHEDYHKPTDDADKINYDGELEVLKCIEHVIQHLDNEGKLVYSKTQDTDMGDIPQFKVRLGIIPDYVFEGPGLRIDGVDDGQPASKAGLQKGDIILQMGDFSISDIMVYMKALSSFQKGDTTKVKVKRNDREMEFQVTF